MRVRFSVELWITDQQTSGILSPSVHLLKTCDFEESSQILPLTLNRLTSIATYWSGKTTFREREIFPPSGQSDDGNRQE